MFAGRLGDSAGLVEAAAWLHDIGYAPTISATDFHPLDGARYLRDVQGADTTLCELVAHHSGAVIEAEERGLAGELTEFERPDPLLLRALTAADLSTDPTGQPITPVDRIAEVLKRYPSDHPVYRAIVRSGDTLVAAAQDFEQVRYDA